MLAFTTNVLAVVRPMISAGDWHSIGLKSDGAVVDWGFKMSPSGLNDVKAIAAGVYHGLALKSNGSVVSWGDNTYGQTSVPAGLTNVVAVAAGNVQSLAIKSDGTVVAWGRSGYQYVPISVPTGLNNVVAVAAGHWHTLALKSDGTVVAWGDNTYGQLNIPIGLSNVIAVSAGAFYSLALKADGTVVVWGGGSVPAGLANVVAISTSYNHSLALKSDGTVIAWGDNTYGQTTIPAGLANVVAVATGTHHSLALKSDGTVVAWGYNTSGQADVPVGLNLGTSLYNVSSTDNSLLSKFSPVMSFHKDDYLPSGIDVFIDHSVLYMSKFSGDIAKKYGNALPSMIGQAGWVSYGDYFDISKSKISLNKFPTILTNTKETFYLDILNHTSYEGSGKDTIEFFYDNGNLLPDELFYRPYELMNANEKVVYGRVLNQNGKKYLQYHFFYLINQWNDGNGGNIIGYHEGDWEGMIIELDEYQNPKRASVSAHVRLASYKGGETKNWQNVSKIGNHPIVYIGKGGHPSYFTKGITDVGLYGFEISGEDDHSGVDVILQNSNLNTNFINRNAMKVNYRLVNIEKDANVKKWLNSPVVWGRDISYLSDGVEKSVQAPKYYDPDRWSNSEKWMNDRE